jgi:hypothetical protein
MDKEAKMFPKYSETNLVFQGMIFVAETMFPGLFTFGKHG